MTNDHPETDVDELRRSLRSRTKEVKELNRQLGVLDTEIGEQQAKSAKKKGLIVKLTGEVKTLDTGIANSRKQKRRREVVLAGSLEQDDGQAGLSASFDRFGNDLKLLGTDLRSQSKNLNSNVSKLLAGIDGTSVKALEGTSEQLAKLIQQQIPDMHNMQDHLTSDL